MLSGKSTAVPYAAMLRTGEGPHGERRKKENFYKGHLDVVLKENKKMKDKLEALDKENAELKRSLYELSQMLGRKGTAIPAFDADRVLRHNDSVSAAGEAAQSFMRDHQTHDGQSKSIDPPTED